jgi:DNA replication licensing factor MCM5
MSGDGAPVCTLQVEQGARAALETLLPAQAEGTRLPTIQVLLTGDLAPTTLRQISVGSLRPRLFECALLLMWVWLLQAAEMNRLLLVPGIIVTATRTRPKATDVTIRCKNCQTERELQVPGGFGFVTLPRECPAL